MKKFNNTQGIISIFLCLIFTLILSITIITVESCHIAATRAYVNGMSYMVTDSSLGNFSRPLFEKYNLLSISAGENYLENFINDELEINTKPTQNLKGFYYHLFPINSYQFHLDKLYHFTDSDGLYFTNQILNYVSLNPVFISENLFALSSYIPIFSKNSIDIASLDISDMQIDNSYQLEEFEDDSIDYKTADSIKPKAAKEKSDSILSRIKELLTTAGLTLYIDDPSEISSFTADTSLFPSHTVSYEKTSSLSASERLFYNFYLMEHFNCYTDKPNKSSHFSYQLEYLLIGKEKDDLNLLKSIQKIQKLRTGLNLFYLLNDNSKRSQAKTVAYAAVGVLAIPFLVEFVQFSLLSAWAYGEAILDVQALLKGKNIPFLKSKSDWVLTLDELTTFDKNKSSFIDNSLGLTYKDYLQLLLFADFSNHHIFRTMDLIEQDISSCNDSDFQISNCISGIQCTFQYKFPAIMPIGNYWLETNLFQYTSTHKKGY